MFTESAYAMGGPAGGGTPAGGATGMLTSFAPLILIFVIFYFLLIRPQSKKAKEHKELLDNIKKGDKVITTGGIHGLVEELNGNVITLKIGVKDEVKIKIDRGHIAGLRKEE
ncbi:MAG: preprotein translocase subunit YajC [Nitrospirae bacterium]|nr:preprotein translocase subunit YajC [Nitrospirota bacterium]